MQIKHCVLRMPFPVMSESKLIDCESGSNLHIVDFPIHFIYHISHQTPLLQYNGIISWLVWCFILTSQRCQIKVNRRRSRPSFDFEQPCLSRYRAAPSHRPPAEHRQLEGRSVVRLRRVCRFHLCCSLRPSTNVSLRAEPRRQDKTYRRYASGIERALASFDTAHLEWPDYISFLGRLLKASKDVRYILTVADTPCHQAIQVHPPTVDNIPHRALVANKLAQCLSPSLPSGVHQKAIEVYSYIFSIVGVRMRFSRPVPLPL